MADITASQIYPSIKYISTDSKGDLQEILGTDATTASGTIQGITITSVATGASANGTTFQIVHNAIADGINYVSADDKIRLTLTNPATDYKLNEVTPAVSASATGLDISATAVTAGDSGNGITVDINENQSSDGISVSGNAVTIDITGLASTRTLNDIDTIISGASSSVTNLVTLTVTGTLSDQVTTGTLTLSGGKDEVDSVSNIIDTAGSDVTDVATITISGADSDTLTGSGSVLLQGAQDATGGELQSNSEYVLISRGDLHSFDTDETTDGRKLLWGLLQKYSDAYYALDSANRPTSLTVNKSNFLTQSDGHSLKQTYTITATYGIDNLDLLAE